MRPRCDRCPAAAGLTCGGQGRNPRYCALAAKGLAGNLAMIADNATGTPAPWEGGAPGGVVQLWPAAYVGGAERAMMSVLKATKGRVPWRGIAVADGIKEPAIEAELRALAPLAVGRVASRAMIAGADLVVAWAMNDFPSWLPAAGRVPKVLMTSHSTDDSAWAVRTLADDRMVTAYAAVSRSALGIIPPHRRADAVVIPNVVDFDRLEVTEDRDSVRASWGVPPGARVLGGLNRLSSEKDPRRLAEAIAAMPPEWHGVMVGSGFERGDLIAHAERVAPGRVHFPGPRLDVGNALAAFDVMLVSSLYESFCLSLAEAIAVGVPVVSTPVGIALDHPGLVRTVPIGASGREIAAAVLGPGPDPAIGRELARSLWSAEAVGDAWAREIALHLPPAPAPPASSPLAGRADPRLALVNACAHRGCKTGCGHSICNRDHREVHIRECLACVSTPRAED